MNNVRHLEGAVVNGWVLERKLGGGADGIVYSGRKRGVQAAVKVYIPEAVKKYGYDQQLLRLQEQLSLRGAKHHKNLVEILEGGEWPELNTLFLVMELVPGDTLENLTSTFPREHIAPLLSQLVDAAKFLAVDKGCFHRDIKPANIIISADYSKLTLLDLGIMLRPASLDERLSGEDFVASTRYSPREFVWRNEDSSNEGWLAITYYQIGATLHDMIMRKKLFAGFDSPAAVLFDSVRDRAPDIQAPDVDPWLVALAERCLTKDWTERLEVVSWDAFNKQATGEPVDFEEQERQLRFRQIKAAEIIEAVSAPTTDPASSGLDLWNLQEGLFSQVRSYLRKSTVFPMSTVTPQVASEFEYSYSFEFREDEKLSFPAGVSVVIRVAKSSASAFHSDISVQGFVKGELKLNAAWTEIFTVQAALDSCLKTLLHFASSIIPQ